MPNHVTNKIVFSADRAAEVFAAVCPEGRFDFSILIPVPLHVFAGNLGSEEEKDFPVNWYAWNLENWGTKWGAYACSSGIENGAAFIKFDTAWSVPYPVISAFANKFKIPFKHLYFDEGHNFWGVETWGEVRDQKITRAEKRRDNQDDFKTLCMELKGYDPTKREEDE